MSDLIFLAERLLSVILAAVMAKAGLAKAKDISGMYFVVENYHLLPGFLVAPATAIITGTELAIAALLLVGGDYALIGGVLGVALQVFFCLIVLLRLNTRQPYGCGCFGVNVAKVLTWGHLGSNLLLGAGFGLLAAFRIWLVGQ